MVPVYSARGFTQKKSSFNSKKISCQVKKNPVFTEKVFCFNSKKNRFHYKVDFTKLKNGCHNVLSE